jgi:hypothetical protein
VYVLGKDQKVRSQEVQTTASSGPFYVVSKGLKVGQQILADGIASECYIVTQGDWKKYFILRQGAEIVPELEQ